MIFTLDNDVGSASKRRVTLLLIFLVKCFNKRLTFRIDHFRILGIGLELACN